MRDRRGVGRFLGRCALVALAGALAGCAADEAGTGEAAPPAPVDPPPSAPTEEPPLPTAPPQRPEVVEGTIRLEGMEEPMRFELYRSPPSFPLPFTTYLPEDMRPAEGTAPEEVRFLANFGGTLNPDAYLAVTALPEGTDRAGAMAAAGEAAGGLGERLAEAPTAPPGWALESIRFRRPDGATGTLHLGERAGRFFLLVVAYPPEYGDGFGPRAAEILEEWRWAGGEGLG